MITEYDQGMLKILQLIQLTVSSQLYTTKNFSGVLWNGFKWRRVSTMGYSPVIFLVCSLGGKRNRGEGRGKREKEEKEGREKKEMEVAHPRKASMTRPGRGVIRIPRNLDTPSVARSHKNKSTPRARLYRFSRFFSLPPILSVFLFLSLSLSIRYIRTDVAFRCHLTCWSFVFQALNTANNPLLRQTLPASFTFLFTSFLSLHLPSLIVLLLPRFGNVTA